jgi:hypothetical protein
VQFLQIIDGEFFLVLELNKRLHKDIVVVTAAGSYAFEAYIRDPLEVVWARLLGNGLIQFLGAGSKCLLWYLWRHHGPVAAIDPLWRALSGCHESLIAVPAEREYALLVGWAVEAALHAIGRKVGHLIISGARLLSLAKREVALNDRLRLCWLVLTEVVRHAGLRRERHLMLSRRHEPVADVWLPAGLGG